MKRSAVVEYMCVCLCVLGGYSLNFGGHKEEEKWEKCPHISRVEQVLFCLPAFTTGDAQVSSVSISIRPVSRTVELKFPPMSCSWPVWSFQQQGRSAAISFR